MEEVMLTSVYAGCNEISVGGSAGREQYHYTPTHLAISS